MNTALDFILAALLAVLIVFAIILVDQQHRCSVLDGKYHGCWQEAGE